MLLPTSTLFTLAVYASANVAIYFLVLVNRAVVKRCRSGCHCCLLFCRCCKRTKAGKPAPLFPRRGSIDSQCPIGRSIWGCWLSSCSIDGAPIRGWVATQNTLHSLHMFTLRKIGSAVDPYAAVLCLSHTILSCFFALSSLSVLHMIDQMRKAAAPGHQLQRRGVFLLR